MRRFDAINVARDFLSFVRIQEALPNACQLQKLTQAFGRFPYENITKIVRAAQYEEPDQRLRLPDVVLEEHQRLGAGGTCFSLAFFFQQILSAQGFQAYPVMCDRSYGPNTHCALIVCIGSERYLVDPGYLLEAPLLLPMAGESVQRGISGTLRLLRLGSSQQYLLISEKGGARKIRYRLRDYPIGEADFLAFWQDSFNWSMMRHLCLSKQTGAGQLFLRDQRLRSITLEGHSQEQVREWYADVVSHAFGIAPGLVACAHDAVKILRAAYAQRGG